MAKNRPITDDESNAALLDFSRRCARFGSDFFSEERTRGRLLRMDLIERVPKTKTAGGMALFRLTPKGKRHLDSLSAVAEEARS